MLGVFLLVVACVIVAYNLVSFKVSRFYIGIFKGAFWLFVLTIVVALLLYFIVSFIWEMYYNSTLHPSLFIILIVLGIINFGALYLWRDRFVVLLKDYTFIRRSFIPLPDIIRSILSSKYYYYKHLNAEEKILFEKRVWRLMSQKDFVACGGLTEVSEEQKILVSAAGVQVLFGLEEVILDNFPNIYLYADDYISRYTGKAHMGDVMPRYHLISLSWKSFLKGFEDPKDSYNMGLHEMAHALKFENYSNDDREFLFIPHLIFETWDKHASPVFDDIRNGKHTFLRRYAGTNNEEFFAVCVEYFFEKPVEFKIQLPTLYTIMRDMLNQDPALIEETPNVGKSILFRSIKERDAFFKELAA